MYFISGAMAGGSGSAIMSEAISRADLIAKRDAGGLKPGQQYQVPYSRGTVSGATLTLIASSTTALAEAVGVYIPTVEAKASLHGIYDLDKDFISYLYHSERRNSVRGDAAVHAFQWTFPGFVDVVIDEDSTFTTSVPPTGLSINGMQIRGKSIVDLTGTTGTVTKLELDSGSALSVKNTTISSTGSKLSGASSVTFTTPCVLNNYVSNKGVVSVTAGLLSLTDAVSNAGTILQSGNSTTAINSRSVLNGGYVDIRGAGAFTISTCTFSNSSTSTGASFFVDTGCSGARLNVSNSSTRQGMIRCYGVHTSTVADSIANSTFDAYGYVDFNASGGGNRIKESELSSYGRVTFQSGATSCYVERESISSYSYIDFSGGAKSCYVSSGSITDNSRTRFLATATGSAATESCYLTGHVVSGAGYVDFDSAKSSFISYGSTIAGRVNITRSEGVSVQYTDIHSYAGIFIVDCPLLTGAVRRVYLCSLDSYARLSFSNAPKFDTYYTHYSSYPCSVSTVGAELNVRNSTVSGVITALGNAASGQILTVDSSNVSSTGNVSALAAYTNGTMTVSSAEVTSLGKVHATSGSGNFTVSYCKASSGGKISKQTNTAAVTVNYSEAMSAGSLVMDGTTAITAKHCTVSQAFTLTAKHDIDRVNAVGSGAKTTTAANTDKYFGFGQNTLI